jgi:GntR family transcriptional regulator/MocR family aminotransferase
MSTRAITNLLIRLDGQQPMQQQIYAQVRRAILDGVVAPGARLLSSRALAVELGISRTTTLLAYAQLTAEGYLTSQHGSGTFVARELPDDLPRVFVSRPTSKPRHPPVSSRGLALGNLSPPARRVGGPPRAFRIGVPALDRFPMRLWSQLVYRRLKSATLTQLDYGDSAGLAILREAIAEHVRTARGTRCGPDQVIVVAGAQRGLEFICRVLLDPGERAWLEEPAYSGARSALVSAGARIIPIRVDREGLDVAYGTRHAGNARLVYVTPSHQFPMGVQMSLARRLALLKWASAARAWIVEDDYDSEFRYGTRPIPCLHGLDGDDRVIYVGSFAKTLFPALRLGFLIVPPDLREVLLAARRASDPHPPVIDQAALADLMIEGHYQRHLRRMCAAYRERLDALAAAADRYCAGVLQLRPVRSGLHAVADLHGVDAVRVFHEAAERSVEVMPLSAYFNGRTTDSNALVLGFAPVGPDALDRGMQKLASAIEAAQGESRLHACAAGARR